MTEILNIKDCIDDLDEVMDMIYDQWGSFFSKTKEEKMKMIKTSIDKNMPFPQIFVMKENEKIIGSFTIKDHDLDLGKYAQLSPWLACVIIKKDCRGKGYGKDILLHIDKVAKENYTNMYLFTEHIGYYEKIGFEFIEEIMHHGQMNRIYKKEY